jgi:hypothetical protein
MKGFEPRSSLHKADAVTTAKARFSHLFSIEQSHGKERKISKFSIKF